MRTTLVAAITCVVAVAAHAQSHAPSDSASWRAATLTDLEAMHALLRDHTPIPFDTENPDYLRWMQEGLATARTRVQQVGDEAGYFYTLAAYANGFQDPHVTIRLSAPPAAAWPGFIAAEQGDEMVVIQRDRLDPAAPPLGARVESCDGKPVATLVRERLAPFALNAGAPLRWAVPDLFLDRGNPFVPLPAKCAVRTGESVAEIPLQWRSVSGVPATFGDDLTNQVFGPEATWGISEPEPGVFWIGIPTFSHGASTRLRRLLDAVQTRGKEMRNARAIVIDVRGNGGGTTIWANQIAEAIFTPKVAKAAKEKSAKGIASDLRASPGNITYLREFVAGLEGSDMARYRRIFQSRIKEMERAERRQPSISRLGESRPASSGGITARRPRDAAPPFKAQVYLLSNGSCTSTCLVFADNVLMVPGVRLIGSATSGDTQYGEVRVEELPSGLAAFAFPQAVMRGRGRGALEAYEADVPYSGPWDDAGVRAWTLGLIRASSRTATLASALPQRQPY